MANFSYLYNSINDTTMIDFLKYFHLGRSKINFLIDSKLCYVNNSIAKRETVIKQNDSIFIDTSSFDTIDFPSYKSKLNVLYEDDYILIVEKPAGVIIYDENKSYSNALDNMVAYYYEITNQQHAVRHVHRLDYDTTGCVLYAKDILSHSFLSNELEEHRFKKVYLCLVCGKIDNSGQIDAKIGRNRHCSGKMMVSKSGLDAFTSYELIDYNKDISLCKVLIKTGRTHQIRVHMSYINHPLVGDKLYGSRINAKRVMLHCNTLTFIHPITRQEMMVESRMPMDFKDYMKED